MAVRAPLPWWRLPFAGALTYHALINKRCQLCGIYDSTPVDVKHLSPRHYDHWFNRQQFLCQQCHDRFVWSNARFTLSLPDTSITGQASWYYQYPLNQIMLEYKNAQQLHHLPVLVHALRQLPVPPGCHSKNSLLIKVPTSLARIRQRGFDPLAILLTHLSFHWQIPVFEGIARYDRAHQQGLSRDQRFDNIKQAFYFNQPPADFKYVTSAKNLILFDDVVTTGATLSELANLIQHHYPAANIVAMSVLHG